MLLLLPHMHAQQAQWAQWAEPIDNIAAQYRHILPCLMIYFDCLLWSDLRSLLLLGACHRAVLKIARWYKVSASDVLAVCAAVATETLGGPKVFGPGPRMLQ